MARGRRQVEAFRVLLHHAVDVVPVTEVRDGRLHPLHPLAWQLVRAALVEEGHRILLQDGVERLRLHRVLLLRIAVDLAAADRPAARPLGCMVLPRLGPPSVQRARVQRAVRRRLHPAGAARLERTARRVEPDVRPLGPPAVGIVKLSTPFIAAFMPLVPLASSGRRGVLSQTSDPWTM